MIEGIAAVEGVARLAKVFRSETGCFEMKQPRDGCLRNTGENCQCFYGMMFALWVTMKGTYDATTVLGLIPDDRRTPGHPESTAKE